MTDGDEQPPGRAADGEQPPGRAADDHGSRPGRAADDDEPGLGSGAGDARHQGEGSPVDDVVATTGPTSRSAPTAADSTARPTGGASVPVPAAEPVSAPGGGSALRSVGNSAVEATPELAGPELAGPELAGPGLVASRAVTPEPVASAPTPSAPTPSAPTPVASALTASTASTGPTASTASEPSTVVFAVPPSTSASPAGVPQAAVPAPTPAAGKRRRWPLWTALGLVLGLVAGAVPGVLLREPDAAGRPAAGAADRGTAAQRQLAERMVGQLDRQAGALLGGDRAGFLAVAEPAARPALTRRYAALRALRVTVWRPAADGVPVAVDGRPGEWRLAVTVGYCFVEPGCAPSTAGMGMRWRLVGEQPRLLAVERSLTDPAGVRPWEVSELAVAVGKRALVATTPAQRAKLPGLLGQAEAAARTADRYAVGPPPDRYLVYYAGKAEWKRWYGGGRPKWTAGYAVGVGGGRHDVVLNAQSLSPAGVDDLLRHELTHAASLPEQGYADHADWWLVEGLAEYAGADGQPVDRYEGLAEVRKLIRGGWSGRLDSVAPDDDATDDRVGGAYGLGYLAVRHLVDRYGEQRVLDFFRAVVHKRTSPAEAADEVFGDPWPELHDDCVAYARAVAG
ncbi:hypothetical protein [Micromonospora sp. WMMD975]|uniref:hypothetical protein n=1 Tax=Micromonospora sp. WMMD975 TaxID=3016087 RepID=UPI002499F0D6|nr:hypothetical protein [Micromonospora sp. WMMD975]WFE32330.1 hypothetical protein O7613_22520 [Micromonospora sp. WMMD975]